MQDTNTRPTKAKRKLSEIDFSREGSHIAIVSKQQGGGANGHNYALAIKGKNFSPEFIEKVQQVKVTLDLPDFLRTFFSMYEENAELLARFFGYVEPEDESEKPESYEDYYENYMMSKLESFEIIKSLYEADNIPELMASLEESEILSLMKDRERLEKAFTTIEKAKSKQVEVPATTTVDKPTEAKPSVQKPNIEKGKQMQTEVQVPIETEADLLLKAQYDTKLVELQKSLEEQIQKNKERDDAFEAFKKEQILKTKLIQISSVIKDKAHAEIISKASYSLADEDFNSFVSAISALAGLADNSSMFVEKGLNVSTDESPRTSKLAEKMKAIAEKNTK